MIQSKPEPSVICWYILIPLKQIKKSHESLLLTLPLLVLIFLKKYQKVKGFIALNLIFLLYRC